MQKWVEASQAGIPFHSLFLSSSFNLMSFPNFGSNVETTREYCP